MPRATGKLSAHRPGLSALGESFLPGPETVQPGAARFPHVGWSIPASQARPAALAVATVSVSQKAYEMASRTADAAALRLLSWQKALQMLWEVCGALEISISKGLSYSADAWVYSRVGGPRRRQDPHSMHLAGSCP